MKIMKKTMVSFLLVFCLVFNIAIVTYPVNATTNSSDYNIWKNRAPRISTEKKYKDKFIIKLVDKNKIQNIQLQKYNTSSKKYENVSLAQNKITISNFNTSKNSQNLTIPATFFNERENTKIKIICKDKSSLVNEVQAELIVKRLSVLSNNGNWFEVTLPSSVSLYAKNEKTLSFTIKDARDIKNFRIKDTYNDNAIVFSKSYDNVKDETITGSIEITKFKKVNNRYRIQIISESTLAKKSEYATIKFPEVTETYEWIPSGYEYNTVGVVCPRYYQSDPRWGKNSYKYKTGGTISRGGCGACALAMAVSGLTKTIVTPNVIVNYLNSKNTNTVYNGAGSAKLIAQKYNLSYQQIARSNKTQIDKALDNGKVCIFSIKANGIYTGGGHFIMCVGRDNNKYYVLESAQLKNKGYYKTNKAYTFNQVFSAGNQGVFVLGKK